MASKQIIGPGGGITASIEGVAELEKTFKALGIKIQRKVLREAARASGNIFLKAAKANAPVNAEVIANAAIEKRAAKISNSANRKIFRRLSREAQSNELLRTKQRPGTLKNSIVLRTSNFQRRGETSLVVRTGTRAEMGIPADSPYYYPAHVEYGHASPGRGGSGEKTTPPHPFMRPAYDGAKNYAKSVAERIMREGVEREAAALNARAVTA